MAELLAPAGSPEALKAAVESGADAVYLAGARFGARAYAENFSLDTLKGAVRYAHLRGVHVHVTVNTLVMDDELEEVAAYLRELYKIGVDAVLVQDLGVAKIARETVPNLPLHASTQMTVTNLPSILALAELGFSRVVLAREMSLGDITALCQASPIEIEVFIHGALCVCYSGQCLMSSMIGARSGNRGRCAQPCRLPYALTGANGEILTGADIPTPAYLLSPKDLNTLELLPNLVEAGVASLKIEGRMKRPEYVATVVKTYRTALDRISVGKNYTVMPQEKTALAQIFNRDFTTAYLEKLPGRDMMSYLRPNNRGIFVGRVTRYNARKHTAQIKLTQNLSVGDQVDFWVKVGGRVNVTVTEMKDSTGKSVETATTSDEVEIPVPSPVHIHDRAFKIFDRELTESARSTYIGASHRRTLLTVIARTTVGEPLTLIGEDADGNKAEVQTEFCGEAAKKRPLTEEILQSQLARLGDTVFELKKADISITGNVMLPLSVINDARRKLTEELERKRLEKYRRPSLEGESERKFGTKPNPLPPAVKLPAATATVIVAEVTTAEAAIAAWSAGAAVLFGGDTYNGSVVAPEQYKKAVTLAKDYGGKLFFATPRVILPKQQTYLEKLIVALADLPPTDIYVHNLGSFNFVRRNSPHQAHIDYSLPVTNRQTLAFWQKQGANGITLSPELTLSQTEEMVKISPLPAECLVGGRLELMLSRYCAAGSFLGNLHTGKCSRPCQKQKIFLRDRKGVSFPLGFDGFCNMHVLNGKSLSMLPYLERLAAGGISRLRLCFKDLPPEEVSHAVKQALAAMHGEAVTEPKDITRGHYFRGV